MNKVKVDGGIRMNVNDHTGFLNEVLLKYSAIKVIISDKTMPVL